MAQKRMFDKSLIDSDLFIDLPIPTQCLYFHLSMRADDEGFIGNVKGILRLVGFKEEDLRPLVERRFIILFETGVIVIRHWKLNNYLRNDRIKETEYKKEKALLLLENNTYNLGIPNGNQMTTSGIPSIEENSIEKNSIEYISTKKFVKPTYDQVKQYCEDNNYKLDYQYFIDYYQSKGWVVGKTPMKDWKATVRNWTRKDKKDVPEWFGKDLEFKEDETKKQEINELLKEFK